MNEDYNWYLENYYELYKEFGDCYAVIKNKNVIGTYKSYAEAVRNAEKVEKLGTFIVQRFGPDETAYTNYISSMNFATNNNEGGLCV